MRCHAKEQFVNTTVPCNLIQSQPLLNTICKMPPIILNKRGKSGLLKQMFEGH